MCHQFARTAAHATSLASALLAAVAAAAGALVLGPAGVFAALGPEEAAAAGIAQKGTH